MHPALLRTDHRPWPAPSASWSWRQSWCDLLFAHWPVPAALLRPLVPPELELQEFEGIAYLGVVPFRMEGVMRRPFPDLPGVSAFPELNVRTYVAHDGKPGVWFFSLDATLALAVWTGRCLFHLPYHRSQIAIDRPDAARLDYRLTRGAGGASFAASYGPTGDPCEARPRTLQHFLTERYCLYAQRPDGALLRTDVQHAPWPLQPAELLLRRNTMGVPLGITLNGPPPLVHFARRVDVVVWSPEAIPDLTGFPSSCYSPATAPPRQSPSCRRPRGRGCGSGRRTCP